MAVTHDPVVHRSLCSVERKGDQATIMIECFTCQRTWTIEMPVEHVVSLWAICGEARDAWQMSEGMTVTRLPATESIS